MALMPVHAASAPLARLVHCGRDTCLRICGHRPDATMAIRIGEQELAVEGGRNWRITVPLLTAQRWGSLSGDTLTVAVFNSHNAIESLDNVALPPGALGHRVELATLVIRAR